MSLLSPLVLQIVSVVVPRNTTIPCKIEEKFVTIEDNQTIIYVRVYEGERSRCIDNNLLGEFTIYGIPPAPRKEGKITVRFDIDANGIMTLSAFCKASGTKNSITIINEKHRLSEEAIRKMILDAERYSFEDEEHKNKVAAKNDLEDYAYDIRKAIRNDEICSIIAVSANKKILRSIDSTLEWLRKNQHAGISEFKYKKEQLRMEIRSICNQIIANQSTSSFRDTLNLGLALDFLSELIN